MPAPSPCIFGCMLLFTAGRLAAADWTVDAAGGRDDAAGTPAAPLKTLAAAMDKAAGGDTIFLRAGAYAAIDRNARPPWRSLYADAFVTVQPAPGVVAPREKISIESVRLGIRSGSMAAASGAGRYDAWLRIRGVRIVDGVYVFGYNHLHIEACRVERIGPHVGSEQDIEKFAVVFGCGDDLVLRDSEVTHTAGGVVLSSLNGRVLNNTIHDITHDGIRCVSSKGCLVEGNRIFNLDDGVDDGDPRGEGWNRHCDAIHIFIPGPGLPTARNSDLTVRGNVMYNCESQAMQFNNYLRVKDVWNERILIENNVFGPTRANAVNIADPVDGIVFRHNTFVHFPEGRSFEGRGRTIKCRNHTFRITPLCRDARIYNNILVNGPAPQAGWFVSNNVVQGDRGVPTRFDRYGADVKRVSPEAFDAALSPDSPAVNAGTARFATVEPHPFDLVGTRRDARPDCGAWELPGQSPPLEPERPRLVEPVTTWLDDFEDGDLAADPWLAGKHRAGLSWEVPEGAPQWQIGTNIEQNWLSAQGHTGTCWVVARERFPEGGLTVTATARNAYNQTRAGILLRANDTLEGYLVEFARGQVIRRARQPDGAVQETVLASGQALLPRTGPRVVRVIVTPAPEGLRIAVDADADGSVELETVDRAPVPASGGRLALVNDSPNGSHRTDWLRIEVVAGAVAP